MDAVEFLEPEKEGSAPIVGSSAGVTAEPTTPRSPSTMSVRAVLAAVKSTRAAKHESPSLSWGSAIGWLETVKLGAKRLLAISLTKRQDRSTFLHESAHAFWELKADLAEATGVHPVA